MRLLIIRHGIAEDREVFAVSATLGSKDDAARPLTRLGRKRMKRAAAGLARLMPSVDLLVTSPLLRAQQTAAIIATRLGVGGSDCCDDLVPDASPARIFRWLRARATTPDSSIALVGHEPHLGRLVGSLIGSRNPAPVLLKKGGACLVETIRHASPGSGTLTWLLTPSQLRALGR